MVLKGESKVNNGGGVDKEDQQTSQKKRPGRKAGLEFWDIFLMMIDGCMIT